MPDELNGQNQEVVVDQSALSTEQQPAEVKQDEQQLPDGASERTKQEFEKLKQHNKELADRLAKLETQTPKTSVLDSLKPKTVQTTPKVEDQSIVDENGYVDEALLKQIQREAQEAKERAVRAEERISSYEVTEQEKRTHKDFPQVDPNSDQFDPNFYEIVRNELIGQMMNGQKQDFHTACEKWAEKFKSTPKTESQETITAKEQINSSGSPTNKQPINREKLIEGTRKGDYVSIAARLAASGF